MKVKLGQAVKMFFGNSSLEMVYFEAIANSLDAGATEIKIDISANALNQPESIKISISDNGLGFTDERFKKFCNLLDVDERSHKGLGRLVYLCYFNEVKILSNYNETFKREIDFTESFSEENARVTKSEKSPSGTNLRMGGYTLSKLGKNNFIFPAYLKGRILEEFYSRLFQLKQEKKSVSIKINATIENIELKEELNNSDIPTFETVELESSINLIDKFYLHFSITEVQPDKTSLIAAVSVDNRTVKVEIIAEENIPLGYNMVFLLYSDWFTGKTDSTRSSLDISEAEFQNIQHIFRNKVASIVEERIPQIIERNKQTRKNLITKFPHLTGYFIAESVGYLSRTEILKKAQDQFFKAQKDLLDANTLTDEQYEKAIELSARALTEYILFRQITIEKLKKSTSKDSEAEIHNIFASMRVQFDKEDAAHDLYRNNAWLLDDKYMTYETVLSDKELGDLITYITEDDATPRDDDRPDLAFVFSNDPNTSSSFDVVIVELKKRGIKVEENMKTVTQLEKRARKLMKLYKNQIQRIWYYGIIEFNEEVELALTGEYKELYSAGKMYYKETKVAIQKNPDIILPIGIFMWDIDAVVKDADARNSAFLNLIKSKFTA
jgi:hypothetical protein